MKSPSVASTALRYGAVVTLGIAVVASIIGYLVAGMPGLAGALIGAGLAAVFMGLTAASILLATRVAFGPDGIVLYFGIILGSWFVKLVLFIVFALWLRGQTWLSPGIFGVTAIIAVLGSLVADGFAFQRSRVPYVDVRLPGDDPRPRKKSPSDS